ncbi:DMT family transporter [Lactiplantibacillus plantarum]|nr:DMT family transporter [Lactiplantibacillus plantarum]
MNFASYFCNMVSKNKYLYTNLYSEWKWGWYFIRQEIKGMLLASIGSLFFGISGVLAQILFQSTEVSTAWLVNLRMTGAGVILLIFLKFRHYDIGTVWKQKYLGLNLIMFGIFGVLFAQSSFLKAVYFGNAAIAPILQSLGPTFVVFSVAIIQHERLNRLDLISNAISLVGIFLLITNGNLQKLYVSPQCIMWGIFSAIGVAAYTLLPRKLFSTGSGGVGINHWWSDFKYIHTNLESPEGFKRLEYIVNSNYCHYRNTTSLCNVYK